jgi:glutamate--cysteine ligase
MSAVSRKEYSEKSDKSHNAEKHEENDRVCDGLWKRPIRGSHQLGVRSTSQHSTASRFAGSAAIGIEMEMFAYDAINLIPLGLPGSVFHPSELLKRMSDSVEGAKLKVDPSTGVVIGLSFASGANFSLEPGGQVEFSSCPRENTESLVEDVVFGLTALQNAARGEVVFLSHGTNPVAPASMPLLVPKERYQILRRYFQSEPTGRGVDMMGHTGTVQPNIDIPGDDSDWEDAVRLAFALTPAVQLLTRNSYFFAGQRSQFSSERQQIWKCTDASRSGIPEGIVHAQDVACHYAVWARNANVFLVRGLPVEEQPLFGELQFQKYLESGFKGVSPTLQDWELHLATLFPEIRLRGFLEIRNLDAQSFEHLLAGVMLWKGLLVEPNARAEAWSLLGRNALSPSGDERALNEFGRELLTLSIESLRRSEDSLGVAALQAAALYWTLTDSERNLPSDAKTFVVQNSQLEPAEAFVKSIKSLWKRRANFRGHPGWGGK